MLLAVTDGNIMTSGRELAMTTISHFTMHREYIHGTFFYIDKDITHNFLQFNAYYNYSTLITVAAWSKGWTVFARLNAGIVGSNPTQRHGSVYSVFVLSCVSVAALRRADHSSKESCHPRKKIMKLKKRPGPNNGLYSHWWMKRIIILQHNEMSPKIIKKDYFFFCNLSMNILYVHLKCINVKHTGMRVYCSSVARSLSAWHKHKFKF
jgi:hypothetical protein